MDRSQLYNDPELALRLAFDGRLSDVWTAMPAIVQKVDFTAMTCEVQPSIQGSTTDENGVVTFVNYPLLVDCPIVFPSAGGFTITMPLAAGDEVLVIFAARCIDSWWQSGGIGLPMEARMHDLSDGFVIPGPKSQPNVLTNVSSTNLQIRNNAGTSYVEIDSSGRINLVSPGGLNITGNLRVTGTIVGQGEVVANAATTPVHLSVHTHPGVTSGGSSTGGPVG